MFQLNGTNALNNIDRIEVIMKELATGKGFVGNLFYPSRRTVEMLKLNEALNEAKSKIISQDRMLNYNYRVISEVMDELEFSSKLAERVTASLEISDIVEGVFEIFNSYLATEFITLLTKKDNTAEITIISSFPISNKSSDKMKEITLKAYEKLTGESFTSTQTKTLSRAKNDSKKGLVDIKDFGKSVSETLLKSGKIINGALFIHNREDLADKHKNALAKVLPTVIRSLDNALKYSKALELSTTDALTGIANRRVFDASIEKEYSRSTRYKSPMSLMLIDIDHFKKFNDTMGHQAGDEVLKAIVAGIAKCIRNTDLLARYGGEEFAIILPETANKEAISTAERIREYIASSTFDIAGQKTEITVSIGCVTVDGEESLMSHEKISSTENMIRIADSMLYKAKESGRNKVCFE